MLSGDNDPYVVLGVSADADDDTIRAAWRHQMAVCHPDRHPPGSAARDEAEAAARRLNDAWSALSDPQRRAELDVRRSRSGPPRGARQSPPSGTLTAVAGSMLADAVDRAARSQVHGAGGTVPPQVAAVLSRLVAAAQPHLEDAGHTLGWKTDRTVRPGSPEAAGTAHLAVGYAALELAVADRHNVGLSDEARAAVVALTGIYDLLEQQLSGQVAAALPGRVTLTSAEAHKRAVLSRDLPDGHPPGWRLDPYTDGMFWRWWDGQRWGDTTHPPGGPDRAALGLPGPPRRRRRSRDVTGAR